MRRETMIKNLKNKFNLTAVPREEFDGHGTTGLWIRDNICKPETDYYNGAADTMTENKLNSFLKKNGWWAEPYDAETIMLINDNV